MEDIMSLILRIVVDIDLIFCALIPILFLTVKKMKDYYQKNKAKVESSYEKLQKILLIVNILIIIISFYYLFSR